MKLIQIPYSHNCVKVRRALELKGLPFETEDIAPAERKSVLAQSGQRRVPVLIDGGRAVVESTAILLYLEERYPEKALLPREPSLRAECLLLEDWADAAFMDLTRRIAYWQILKTPGRLEGLFFPGASGPARLVKGIIGRRLVVRRFGLSEGRNRGDEAEAVRVAKIAIDRLGGRPFLVGDGVTIADITLAAMAAPLDVAANSVKGDASVAALLAWGRGILGG
jgi:glutathione S-transferase